MHLPLPIVATDRPGLKRGNRRSLCAGSGDGWSHENLWGCIGAKWTGRFIDEVPVLRQDSVFKKRTVSCVGQDFHVAVPADVKTLGRVEKDLAFRRGIAGFAAKGSFRKLDLIKISDRVIRHIQFGLHLIKFRVARDGHPVEKILAEAGAVERAQRPKVARAWGCDPDAGQVESPAAESSAQLTRRLVLNIPSGNETAGSTCHRSR